MNVSSVSPAQITRDRSDVSRARGQQDAVREREAATRLRQDQAAEDRAQRERVQELDTKREEREPVRREGSVGGRLSVRA